MDSLLTRFVGVMLVPGALVLGAGCGDGVDEAPDAQTPTPDAMVEPDAGPTPDADTGFRTVNGAGNQVHVTPSGETQLDIDFAPAVVQALVPDQTGFTTIIGAGGNGTFTIEDVPSGEYYLRINDSYYVTSSSTVTLSRRVVGRADAVPATTTPTPLDFDVDSMPAWDFNDQLSWFDPGSGAYFPAMEFSIDPYPAANATTLTTSVDYSQAFRPYLIDTTEGDAPVLTQFSWENIDQADIDWIGSAIATFSPSPLTMTDGQTSSATGSFTTANLDQQLDLDWKVSEFMALVDVAHPNAVADDPWFTIQAQAAGSEYGPFGIAYDLFSAYAASGRDTDIQRVFDYAQPFNWDRSVVTQVELYTPLSLPSRTVINSPSGFIYTADVLGDVATNGLAPLVGPPTSVLIDDQDATADRDGVGSTPVVSWSAPTVGSPAMYRVEVHRLAPQGADGTRAVRMARIWTNDTSVKIPPGVLTNGQYYFIRVVALQSPGLSIASSPFTFTYPYGEATAISGRISP